MMEAELAASFAPTGLVLPNFLIAGAAKAGTTSLYEYLKQHPDVFLPLNPKQKEPTFFVDEGAGIRDPGSYAEIFKDSLGEKAIGESSTAYLYCPVSPARIRATLGDVKIIILLRNPARRAFSLWAYMAKQGYESARTFEEGLAREDARLCDSEFRRRCLRGGNTTLQDYLYFHSGLYYEQVRRYVETFGRSRVRVYIFEEFVADPLKTCRDVFRFLEVDDRFEPTISVHNEGRIPLSIPLQCWIQSLLMGERTCHPLRLVPRSQRGRLLKWVKAKNTTWGQKRRVSPSSSRRLMEAYGEDIRRLEQLLGRDLTIWTQRA